MSSALHWADFYRTCGHESQSPIDIGESTVAEIKEFEYGNYDTTDGIVMELSNNGHSGRDSWGGGGGVGRGRQKKRGGGGWEWEWAGKKEGGGGVLEVPSQEIKTCKLSEMKITLWRILETVTVLSFWYKSFLLVLG